MSAPHEHSGLLDSFADRIAARPRVPAGRIILTVVSLVLVGLLLAGGLPWATGATWATILAVLTALPGWAVPAVAALGIVAVLAEGLAVHAVAHGSRLVPAVAGQTAAGALALAIPGGAMLGVGMLGWVLRRTGLGLRRVLAAVVTASVLEIAVSTVLLPLVGLAAYALASLTGSDTQAPPGGLTAAILAAAGGILVCVLLVALTNRSLLRQVLDAASALTGRASLAADALAIRDDAIALLRTRGAAGTALVLLARVAQLAAFALALRAAGIELPALLVLAVFALGRAVAQIPVTPGGAGLTETAVAAALVALGSASAQSAAVALLMAVATLIVPLLAGALSVVVVVGGRRAE